MPPSRQRRRLSRWITGLAVLLLVLTGSFGVRFFQVPGRPFRRLPFPPGPTPDLLELRFSPDGRWLAAWQAVAVWDTTTWNLVFQPGGRSQFGGFSANGSRLLTVERGRVRLWDTGSWRELPLTVPTTLRKRIKHAQLAPDGHVVAAWDGLRTVVWDTTTGVLHSTMPGCDFLLFVPNQETLAYYPPSSTSSGTDQRILLSRWRTGKTVKVIPAVGIEFSPDGRRAVTDSALSSPSVLWDTTSWKQFGTIPTLSHDTAAFPRALTPDSTLVLLAHVATRYQDAPVALHDLDSGLELMAVPGNYPFDSCALSPNGALLAVINNNQVELWSVPPRPQLLLNAYLRRLLRK